uniref:Uncharacterized protein n=1 Tax=Helianthus annuus TaxID=4232 RepID=A0A251SGF1_HELAN
MVFSKATIKVRTPLLLLLLLHVCNRLFLRLSLLISLISKNLSEVFFNFTKSI